MKTSSTYDRVFWEALRGREVSNATLREGSVSGDSYFAPSEFRDTLEQSLAKQNVFRRRGTTISLIAPEGAIQAVTSTGEANWTPESVAFLESADTVAQFPVRSHKLAAMSRIKESFLLDMNFDLEGYLRSDFALRFSRAEEAACISGDGLERPTGILHDTLGGEVAVTTEAADKISYDEVVQLYFSLKSEYRQNAIFLTNDITAMQLRLLKDEVGNPLWRSSDDSIFGKPVVTSPYMPTMAEGAKTIAFGDLSYFWLVERQPLTIRRLSELYAVQNQIGFMAFERLDGRLIRPEAVQVLQMAG